MSIKSGRNPWVRFILFFVILIGAIQVISDISVRESHFKNGNYWPYFYKELPENSVDIVFMGNSHSNTTFIPEVIDDILGTQSTHVNTSGESVYQTLFEYQEVLRRQNPKMVIIETYPIYAGLAKEDLKPWNYSFFYAMPFSLSKFIYAHQFFPDIGLLNFYLPFTMSHSGWKNPSEEVSSIVEELKFLKGKLGTEPHEELPYRGYVNYLKSLVPGEKDAEKRTAGPICPVPDMKGRLAITEEILKISRKNSGGLAFIETPQYFNEYESCRGQASDLIQSYGVPYKRLLIDQDRPMLWFGDIQHMTQFGAVIASLETAEYLAEALDIPMNAEALDFYRSYFFQDYTLHQEGNQVTLRLIPFNGKSSSDLEYEWEVSLNEEPFHKVEGKGMNELKFILPEPAGEYFIHITIHDTAGKYYLRGGFDFIPK